MTHKRHEFKFIQLPSDFVVKEIAQKSISILIQPDSAFIKRLHWVFVTVRRLSLVVVSGGYSLLRYTDPSLRGFSCCRAQALGARAQ